MNQEETKKYIRKTKERIAVMQAYADDKEIEFYDVISDKWLPVMGPSWESHISYRIKPTPKYRPFESSEECWNEMLKHEPFGWIKDHDGIYFQIQCTDGSEGRFERSFKRFTFVDGKPFGVIEESK